MNGLTRQECHASIKFPCGFLDWKNLEQPNIGQAPLHVLDATSVATVFTVAVKSLAAPKEEEFQHLITK